ncbi:unnamed protein product, partial [Anisakis simplex]|uniref:Uncharacterized protein n=1 Tax=Anisakis simplex TaxID=6269 RepID=A0A0M3JM62_ANISI
MFGVQSGAQQKQEGEVGAANVNAPRTSNLFGSIMSSSTSSTQQQQSTQKTSSSENALNKPLAGA